MANCFPSPRFAPVTMATLQREHKKLLAQARELEATAGRLVSILESL
ncbi:hypothetical protein [Brevibacterium linens]|nr:hypothetical protein [Brevibacterium linens]